MQQITIDLTPSGMKAVCYASQYDVGRSIRFALRDKGQVYTLAGTETITLKIRKPDGTERTENIANTSSSYVDLVTSRDTCDMSGEYECELRFANGDVDIGSGNFIMQVEADAFDGLITIKTASGTIASFSTSLPFPLNEAKFTLPYKAGGYIELSHYNSKTTPVIDETPYQTRIAPSNIGNMALEKLVGVSCVFNQLQEMTSIDGSVAGITASITDGVFTISGTAGANGSIYIKPNANGGVNIPANHVLLFTHTGNNNDFKWRRAGFPSWDNNYGFSKHNAVFYCSIQIEIENSRTYNASVKFNVFDLTAMFGSEVADYIYTLESGTAGAGVSLFKSLFGEDYYPYTANTLMSAKPTGKKIVGFNQWDEEWELGSYSWNTGVPYPDNTRIRNSNYIPVFPNTNYYNSNSGYAVDYYFYDENHNFLSPIYKAAGNQTITTPNNCRYMNFCIYATYGTTYNHDICINISSSKNGTYEPYSETTIVYSCNELRGLLKVGTDGLYADGDTDDGSGTGIVRYEKRAYQSGDERIDDAITDGTYTVVKLATPTTQTISAWTNPIVAKEGGTEEFTDSRTVKMFTGHDTIYGTDLSVKKAEFGQVIYGGDYEVVSGVLTSRYNSDGTQKATPDIIRIAPEVIMAMAGNNNIWNEAGNSEVKYIDMKGEGT